MNYRNISDDKNIKQIKLNVTLDNIKSNYILKNILSYMIEYKRLEIMQYNKKLQKRLNLDINNYKECSQLYSNIKIELKPFENNYGKFINIDDEDKKYYHIYFDNSNKEIKRNY